MLPGIKITDSISNISDDWMNYVPMSEDSIEKLGFDSLNKS